MKCYKMASNGGQKKKKLIALMGKESFTSYVRILFDSMTHQLKLDKYSVVATLPQQTDTSKKHSDCIVDNSCRHCSIDLLF